jgi:hypothetical protein
VNALFFRLPFIAVIGSSNDLFILGMSLKKSIDVPCAVNDVQDVEMAAQPSVIRIAKKNDVIAIDDAAIAGAELRPVAAQKPGQGSKALAEFHYLVDETLGHCAALAFLFDVTGDIGKIAESRRAVNETRHLGLFGGLAALIEMLTHILAHVIAAMASAFGFRGIKHVAQLGALGAVHRITHGFLCRRKAARGNGGFNPLGSIGC